MFEKVEYNQHRVSSADEFDMTAKRSGTVVYRMNSKGPRTEP